MPPAAPISQIPKGERQKLLNELNYLNTAEIKAFCKRHSIPYTIVLETKEGLRKTQEDDRKGVILGRVRHFLKTGAVLPETRFAAAVVCFEPLPAGIGANDRLHYGQYEKGNRHLTALLKDLTGGHYRGGAIARILMREFWSRGTAPTFREFATAWLEVSRQHTRPNPEWAFLSDRARGTAGADWKKVRSQKSKRVLQLLSRISVKR
jgi:hypothetical protein